MIVHRVQRRGAKLIELAVVLGILVVLGSLFFPSVCRVRIPAYRIATTNNLRQVAIALLNHESANQRFPLGYDATTGESFYYHIRGEIEAEQYVDDDGTARPFNSFLCPTRRTATTCAPGTAPADFGFANSTEEARTILGGGERVAIREIEDGTEYTLLLTLISMRPSDYPGRNGVDSPWPKTNYGRALQPFVCDTGPAAGDLRLGGPYTGAIPCTFAGGSTRMLSYDINETEMKSLWTYAGGDDDELPPLD